MTNPDSAAAPAPDETTFTFDTERDAQLAMELARWILKRPWVANAFKRRHNVIERDRNERERQSGKW